MRAEARQPADIRPRPRAGGGSWASSHARARRTSRPTIASINFGEPLATARERGVQHGQARGPNDLPTDVERHGRRLVLAGPYEVAGLHERRARVGALYHHAAQQHAVEDEHSHVRGKILLEQLQRCQRPRSA